VKIFVSQNLAEVEALKSRIEDEGIPCFVKNQFTSSLAGEVPFAEVFPELWVVREEDGRRAKALLVQWKTESDNPGQGWTCGRCGERHEGQFTTCWKCGADRGQPWTGGGIAPSDSK